MRVVSANLQHGVPDPEGRPRLARAVAPLRVLDADVYALQELDRRRCRTWWADQPARMAEALGGELLWGRGKGWLWAAQCNALVVRGRVAAREVLRLPGRGERRMVLLADVVVGGERWSVGCTHLSLDPRVAVRQLQVALDALAERPGPWVLAGDLNLRPERAGPVAGATGWTLVEGPPTVNARAGSTRRLDHVLAQRATVAASGVQKLPVSDHLAVWADLHPT